MALSCPRCGTDVPNEALYCPYCSLPKPKRGFVAETEENLEEVKPADPPKPRAAFRRPSNKSSSNRSPSNKSDKPAKRLTAGPKKPERRLRVSVLSLAGVVAIVSVGIYIFVVPMVYSEQAEPKTVLSAMEKLRRLPSAEQGLTVDARLLREIETSRRVGNLVGYQGWEVRPIKGTKSKVLLVFSFQEVGDIHQSAAWVADLTNNTFTPQTELAKTVSGR